MIRSSIIDRGRAIPLVWKVLEHHSSRVAYEAYKDVWDRASTRLPLQCRVIFLADRGFADPKLMAHLSRLDWHWRIRIKGSVWIDRGDHHGYKVNRLALSPGEACFWPRVYSTQSRYGPVHFARAWSQDSQENWVVVSDEPTESKTFDEYG